MKDPSRLPYLPASHDGSQWLHGGREEEGSSVLSQSCEYNVVVLIVDITFHFTPFQDFFKKFQKFS